MTSPLQAYCEAVCTRLQRDGWVEVIMPILAPLIAQLIGQCFKNGPQMRQSLENLNFAQRLAIMQTARQITADAGIPILRGRARATSATANAIEAELRAALQRDAGPDLWQEAFDEATRYSG